MHRLVAASDLTVYVNAGYHLGFGGGWKSVCVCHGAPRNRPVRGA